MPLEVEHGKDSTALGFAFGEVLYISDVSNIPGKVYAMLHNLYPNGIGLLIIDSLRPQKHHISHICIEEAVDVARKLKPRKTFLIGMGHDVDHNIVNTMLLGLLETDKLDVELSYDGLKVPVNLSRYTVD